jgi:hypothetical protein
VLRVQARRISIVGVIRVYGTVVVKSVGGQRVRVHGSRDGSSSGSSARLGLRVEQLRGVDRSISVYTIEHAIINERVLVSNAQGAGADETRGRLPWRDVVRHSGGNLDRAVSTWGHWPGGAAAVRVIAVRTGRGYVSLGETALVVGVGVLGVLGSESIVRGLGRAIIEGWGTDEPRIRSILEMGRSSLCRWGRVEGGGSVEVVEIVGGRILLHDGRVRSDYKKVMIGGV